MKENTVDNRAAPKTILYSCWDPARLSTRWSAFCGLSRENQSNIVSSIPVVPSRWENWRPMSRIYASAKFPMRGFVNTECQSLGERRTPLCRARNGFHDQLRTRRPDQWAIPNLMGAPGRPHKCRGELSAQAMPWTSQLPPSPRCRGPRADIGDLRNSEDGAWFSRRAVPDLFNG